MISQRGLKPCQLVLLCGVAIRSIPRQVHIAFVQCPPSRLDRKSCLESILCLSSPDPRPLQEASFDYWCLQASVLSPNTAILISSSIVIAADVLATSKALSLPCLFAVVTVDSEETHRTKVADSTWNPCWYETFKM